MFEIFQEVEEGLGSFRTPAAPTAKRVTAVGAR